MKAAEWHTDTDSCNPCSWVNLLDPPSVFFQQFSGIPSNCPLRTSQVLPYGRVTSALHKEDWNT